MKTFTIDDLEKEYNDLKLRWSYIDIKDFLEYLRGKYGN